MKLSRKKIFFLLVSALFLEAFPASTRAATYCVVSGDDKGGTAEPGLCNDDPSCSATECNLREAIEKANQDTVKDIIIFSPSLNGATLSWTNNGGGTSPPIVTEPVDIQGLGSNSLTIDANGNPIGLNFQVSGEPFSLSDLALTGAVAQQLNINNGNLTISDCKIINGPGRGIGSVGAEVTLTIRNSTISGNTSPDDDFAGGGLTFDGGTLLVENSTFSDNTAPTDTSFDIGGGAISIYDDTPTEATLTNVTISGNEAEQSGGGILIDGTFFVNTNPLNVHLTNVTIANNMAESNGNGNSTGGGIFVNLAAEDSVELNNVLIADNSVGTTGTSQDCLITGTGAIASNGFNLVEDATGCTGLETSDITGEDPLLGALQSNGGPTDTQALGDGSPAINAGGDCPPPATDQRGVSRPQGSACDIGAFEAVVCGDGTTGSGEDCEPDEECCTADCQFAPAGTACDNGNGECTGSSTTCQAASSGGGCMVSSMATPSSLNLIPTLLALAGLVFFRRKVG